MNCTIQAFYDLIEYHLSAELFSIEAKKTLRSASRLLPASKLAGFECRLRDEQPRVDFQVRLPKSGVNLHEKLPNSDGWIEARNLYREFLEPNSSINKRVSTVGIELDITDQVIISPSTTTPCVFLWLRQNEFTGYQSLIELIEEFQNQSISSLLKLNLRSIVDSLPENCRVSQLGMMQSRLNNGVRINVKGCDFKQIPFYLESIGCINHSNNNLSCLISELSNLVDSILLSFDVGDTISPRIGLECFIEHPWYVDRRPWEAFLSYLVERGLCSRSKRNALLDWPNLKPSIYSSDLLKSSGTWCDLFLASNAKMAFMTNINHIKLIYQSGRVTEAKGYLSFGYKWINSESYSYLQSIYSKQST